MKLKDLAKLIGIERVVATNIDDVIFKAKELGIKELEVSIEEMNIIIYFYLANSGDKDPAKPKILREGKIDRYLGIDIKELPKSLIESRDAGNKTYLVINNSRLLADPEDLNLELVAVYPKAFRKPGTREYNTLGPRESLYLFEVK